jgi:choline-sulfatase
LAHGGMRQKNFNAYEESLRVPLVYSNPRLWRKPQTSHVMVSHVDFLPTLASLVDAPLSARGHWQGVDYSNHILGRLAPPPQDYVVFTYDDYQAGQTSQPYVKPPQHIVSLRERRWKIAQYYDANAKFLASGRCTTSGTTRSRAPTLPIRDTSEPWHKTSSIGACTASWRA